MRAPYTDRLGIDLRSKKEEDLFRWFLACLLFGKPIQAEIAERAYHKLIAEYLTSPEAFYMRDGISSSFFSTMHTMSGTTSPQQQNFSMCAGN